MWTKHEYAGNSSSSTTNLVPAQQQLPNEWDRDPSAEESVSTRCEKIWMNTWIDINNVSTRKRNVSTYNEHVSNKEGNNSITRKNRKRMESLERKEWTCSNDWKKVNHPKGWSKANGSRHFRFQSTTIIMSTLACCRRFSCNRWQSFRVSKIQFPNLVAISKELKKAWNQLKRRHYPTSNVWQARETAWGFWNKVL